MKTRFVKRVFFLLLPHKMYRHGPCWRCWPAVYRERRECMTMGMEVGIFLAYAAGMLIVYLAGRFLLVPLELTGKILLNSIAGGLLIILLNWLGSGFGVFVPLNVFTALTVGVLGVPGLVMMIVFFMCIYKLFIC